LFRDIKYDIEINKSVSMNQFFHFENLSFILKGYNKPLKYGITAYHSNPIKYFDQYKLYSKYQKSDKLFN
jgi:hypothetical protein